MFCWLWHVIGICLGNSMWLVGMVGVGVGIFGLKVKKESIMKVVGLMSMMTGGQPQGFALTLKGLVEPEDKRSQFGKKMLLAGIVLVLIGCTFIGHCAG